VLLAAAAAAVDVAAMGFRRVWRSAKSVFETDQLTSCSGVISITTKSAVPTSSTDVGMDTVLSYSQETDQCPS
jgi:hypothetical protein